MPMKIIFKNALLTITALIGLSQLCEEVTGQGNGPFQNQANPLQNQAKGGAVLSMQQQPQAKTCVTLSDAITSMPMILKTESGSNFRALEKAKNSLPYEAGQMAVGIEQRLLTLENSIKPHLQPKEYAYMCLREFAQTEESGTSALHFLEDIAQLHSTPDVYIPQINQQIQNIKTKYYQQNQVAGSLSHIFSSFPTEPLDKQSFNDMQDSVMKLVTSWTTKFRYFLSNPHPANSACGKFFCQFETHTHKGEPLLKKF